jgi:hypothetical protein
MVARMTWLARIDRLCAVVLLLPFLMLALLPANAMPRVGPDGLTLVLCNGDGPLSEGAIADRPCDWAGAAVDLPQPCRHAAPPPVLLTPLAVTLPAALTGPAHDPRGVMARGPPSV